MEEDFRCRTCGKDVAREYIQCFGCSINIRLKSGEPNKSCKSCYNWPDGPCMYCGKENSVVRQVNNNIITPFVEYIIIIINIILSVLYIYGLNKDENDE